MKESVADIRVSEIIEVYEQKLSALAVSIFSTTFIHVYALNVQFILQ